MSKIKERMPKKNGGYAILIALVLMMLFSILALTLLVPTSSLNKAAYRPYYHRQIKMSVAGIDNVIETELVAGNKGKGGGFADKIAEMILSGNEGEKESLPEEGYIEARKKSWSISLEDKPDYQEFMWDDMQVEFRWYAKEHEEGPEFDSDRTDISEENPDIESNEDIEDDETFEEPQQYEGYEGVGYRDVPKEVETDSGLFLELAEDIYSDYRDDNDGESYETWKTQILGELEADEKNPKRVCWYLETRVTGFYRGETYTIEGRYISQMEQPVLPHTLYEIEEREVENEEGETENETVIHEHLFRYYFCRWLAHSWKRLE